jgi:hypothetical protein
MDIEQLEAFALGDRAAALAQLVPGSEDHDYYRCLWLEQQGQLAQVQALLDEWPARHGHGERYSRLRARQLLRAAATLDPHALRDLALETGASLDHQPEQGDERERHPTALDPALLDETALVERAWRDRPDLSTLTEVGLWTLLTRPLDPTRRRLLLERLPHAGHPAVLDAIAADLTRPDSKGFGSLAIHATLTRDQLDELARRFPTLSASPWWVDAQVRRMRPAPHVDWDGDPEVRAGYVEALWQFCAGLAPVFNSLRAHVSWHRLDLARRQGRYDRALLVEHLRLPRRAGFAAEGLRRGLRDEALVDPGRDFAPLTGLARPGDDEELITDYLMHLLVDDDGADLVSYLDSAWLTGVLATARLLVGREPERWAHVLGPARAAALRDRIELAWTLDNPERLGADDPVTLALHVKNVPTLVVKVFRVDALAYFLARGEEVTTAIDLDGLAGSDEQVVTFGHGPMRRIRHELSLPACAAPGTYVVEAIGAGVSSRAVLRKGSAWALSRASAAGAVLTIVDERGALIAGASAWMSGREYRAGADGTIDLPFSTRGGIQRLAVVAGGVCEVQSVVVPVEQVTLALDVAVEREALVASGDAAAVLRLGLTIGGAPAPLQLLEGARVEIAIRDGLGLSTSKDEPLPLRDDRDAVVRWRMPADPTEVVITVRGKVRVLSTQQDLELQASHTMPVRGVARGDATEALYLTDAADGYRLSVLGRTGEPKPRRVVTLTLWHQAVTRQVEATVETDDEGAIALGPLAGVTCLVAATAHGRAEFVLRRWALPTRLTWVEGDEVGLPLPIGLPGEAARAMARLFEVRAGAFAADDSAHLRAELGALTAPTLPAGHYQLVLPGQVPVTMMVMPRQAARHGRIVALPTGQAEVSATTPWLREVQFEDDALVLRLGGADGATRVHVAATRFASEPAGTGFGLGPEPGPLQPHRARHGAYVSGRELGDEYRYVLERKGAPRRTGILAERPPLLLNPWAVRATSTAVAHARAGAAYGAEAARPAPAPAMMRSADRTSAGRLREEMRLGQDRLTPLYDFVPVGQRLLANLVPDAAGVVRIARAALAGAATVTIELVGAAACARQRLRLARPTEPMRDLRLATGLDPDGHAIERQQLLAVAAGASITLASAAAARFEVVDSVAAAHRYLLALGVDEAVREFAWLTRWHDLPELERRARYSKHTCHEVNLFLAQHDPAFFAAVIVPHLRNKDPRTFVDRYLLGEDLRPYLAPARLARLNLIERALLARRLGAAGVALARSIADQVDLQAPDPERDARLVDALLGAGDAAGGDGDDGGSPPPAPSAPPGLGGSSGVPMMARAPMAVFADAAAEADDESTGEHEYLDLETPKMSKAKKRAAPPRAGGEGAGGGADAGDLARRTQAQPMYRGADLTQEWAEQNWWRRRADDHDWVAVNRFWRDVAGSRDGAPVASPFVGEAIGSLGEALCALALLAVPLAPAPHQVVTSGGDRIWTAGSAAIIARRQIEEVPAPSAGAGGLLLGQNLLRADDRVRWDGAEQRENYVSGELLTDVVYVAQVAVSNPTGSSITAAVLTQVPVGAITVGGGAPLRTHHVVLGPYQTHVLEYGFYFAQPGRFSHLPAQAAVRGVLVAWASASTTRWTVVREPSVVDAESWHHLAQRGSLDQVVAFLGRDNLGRIELDRVAWRLRDPRWFAAVTAALAARHHYHDGLWAYALLHADRDRLGEWLAHQGHLLEQAGAVDGGLVPTGEEDQGWHEHLEYGPLVNARAHRLGRSLRILNDGLAAQYAAALEWMTQRVPTARDRLRAAHYLFVQDRVDAALAQLAQVAPGAAPCALQEAYLRAYAAVATGDLATARAALAPWLTHPVDRWRDRASALQEVIDEAGGGPAGAGAPRPDDRDQRLAALAQAQPSFELALEGGNLVIDHTNLGSLELRLHRMELELLFSRQPFMQREAERFAFVEPALRLPVTLTPTPGSAAGRTTVAVPAAMRADSVVIEAVAAGTRKAVARYAHDLQVITAHHAGQIAVRRASTGAALPAVYVKVFARQPGGVVAFYKDGYTDLRGRFDYATVSTDDLDRTERFAILVASDDAGAVVVEAAPPAR